MIIIETCPKCGHDLHDEVICTYPPIPRKACYSCGWSWEGQREEVVRVPFGGNSLECDKPSVLNDYTSLNLIVDNITEAEIQEYLSSSINTIGTIITEYSNKAIIG